MAKNIENYSVAELEALIAQKKQGEIDTLKERIKEVQGTLTQLNKDLANLTGKPFAGIVLGVKRAPNGVGKANEEAVLKFLQTKKSATTSEIREGTGIDKLNAALGSLAGAGKIEQKEKRADGKGKGAWTLKK